MLSGMSITVSNWSKSRRSRIIFDCPDTVYMQEGTCLVTGLSRNSLSGDPLLGLEAKITGLCGLGLPTLKSGAHLRYVAKTSLKYLHSDQDNGATNINKYWPAGKIQVPNKQASAIITECWWIVNNSFFFISRNFIN
jgi:hypothetical protein